MPAKNSIKIFLENGYYHAYNRGAGKTEIFLDDQDYQVFLHYLEKYLDKASENSLAKKVKLLAYCLMPNHFHLFVQQLSRDGLTIFMRSLCTSYVMYYNKKHQRSGTLFQGIYKAALVESEPYFLHLSRYIHLNPSTITDDWIKYPYSSYDAYLGKKQISWIDPAPILDFFKVKRGNGLFKHFSYQEFIEDSVLDSKEILQDATID
ncbi:hypothetical protein A3A60_00535 [Candidatus Curtissbacteria bacterium RIFCSPLOWO2_01_FULL_42_26]|uniref:Transposase IS200-like domain-containing protein n=1 Tax=Candidatus Curtissbacteria bacterium RIFCSPLOWO2_01_FULL_42_26 TaxID=1797729 RepID=A0A1F5I158_9BACT|nr:MAG: hypothetical protein A3A60_00535 [Candidatus Curtissbacteria bacterium RIFCSPLOWO2_01_FULL_42_26]